MATRLAMHAMGIIHGMNGMALADADAALKRGEAHRSHQQHSYLSRSRYELQLQRFEALFVPEQLLVLRSEDLFERPQQLWQQVLVPR